MRISLITGEEMGALEDQIRMIARQHGAALVGIAPGEKLACAPPSGDPRYILPSARSVVSVAIPLDRLIIREFLRKRNWLAHGSDQKRIYQQLYTITDRLSEFLSAKGFAAQGVEANSVYRSEPGGTDAINRVQMVPDFSHRYAAVAAGLGWLGWSGNLMTPEYGSAVFLASVVTAAELQPDPMLETNPCDECKLCAAACPVEMIRTRETDSVTIGNREYVHGQRETNARCLIGCGGYHGLSPNRTWSSWSPYRVDYPFPTDESEVIALSRRVRAADPDKRAVRAFLTQRDKCFDPAEAYINTCGHCQLICWERRQDREKNRSLLVSAGVVALSAEGRRVAMPAAETMELETPYGVRVARPRHALQGMPAVTARTRGRTQAAAETALDAEVMALFCQKPS